MGRYFCGIYNAPVKSNIDDLIETMAKLNAVLSVLDIKLYNRFNIKVKGNCGCDLVNCSGLTIHTLNLIIRQEKIRQQV